MPVITALEVHQRNRERVKLFLDDEFAMDLPLLQAAHLRKGQRLTQTEIDELAQSGALQNAYDRAVRFLSYRPRSSEEVRRYLMKNGLDEVVVSEVIERLRCRAYLDDPSFARFWLESRNRSKPLAPRALRYELWQKGVDSGIIDSMLASFDANDAAYRAARGRINRYKGQTRQVFKQKLSGMLHRRGFDGDIINDVIRRLQQELDESEDGYFRPDTHEH